MAFRGLYGLRQQYQRQVVQATRVRVVWVPPKAYLPVPFTHKSTCPTPKYRKYDIWVENAQPIFRNNIPTQLEIWTSKLT